MGTLLFSKLDSYNSSNITLIEGGSLDYIHVEPTLNVEGLGVILINNPVGEHKALPLTEGEIICIRQLICLLERHLLHL